VGVNLQAGEVGHPPHCINLPHDPLRPLSLIQFGAIMEHFLPKDAGTWALYISVLGLILIIPLNILSNIITPKLQNWWAERSKAATRKRIEKLEQQLADYEQCQELTELEDFVLKAIEGVGILAVFCIELLAILILLQAVSGPVFVGSRSEVAPPDIRFLLVTLGACAAILGFVVQRLVFEKLGQFRRKRSPFDRKVLRKYIEGLKEKLTKRTH
jgi:hypothetical protein